MAKQKPKRTPEEIEAMRKLVFEAGKSYRQVGQEFGLTGPGVHYLVGPRKPSGAPVKQLTRNRHSKEHTVWCARKWTELFHVSPASTDWTPWMAKRRGQFERAQRYYKFRKEYRCPSTNTVYEQFGSWSEMLRKAGLDAPPVGYRARGYWRGSDPETKP
jgi:hypothetical protein